MIKSNSPIQRNEIKTCRFVSAQKSAKNCKNKFSLFKKLVKSSFDKFNVVEKLYYLKQRRSKKNKEKPQWWSVVKSVKLHQSRRLLYRQKAANRHRVVITQKCRNWPFVLTLYAANEHLLVRK